MELEIHGKLLGLCRKIGKIGGEYCEFKISHHDLEAWNRLIAFAEQEVTIKISAPQGEFEFDGGSSTGSKKEPKGKHTVRDEAHA